MQIDFLKWIQGRIRMLGKLVAMSHRGAGHHPEFYQDGLSNPNKTWDTTQLLATPQGTDMVGKSVKNWCKYTNFLVNTDSFYENFINADFQKIPIPHITCPMKQKFLH